MHILLFMAIGWLLLFSWRKLSIFRRFDELPIIKKLHLHAAMEMDALLAESLLVRLINLPCYFLLGFVVVSAANLVVYPLIVLMGLHTSSDFSVIWLAVCLKTMMALGLFIALRLAYVWLAKKCAPPELTKSKNPS